MFLTWSGNQGVALGWLVRRLRRRNGCTSKRTISIAESGLQAGLFDAFGVRSAKLHAPLGKSQKHSPVGTSHRPPIVPATECLTRRADGSAIIEKCDFGRWHPGACATGKEAALCQ